MPLLCLSTHKRILLSITIVFLFLQLSLQKNVNAQTSNGIDLIILLDQSGSMSRADENGPATDPDGIRIDAARYLIEYLAFDNNSVNTDRVNRVVVIGFGSYAELLVNLTTLNSKGNVESAQEQIVKQNLGDTSFISALRMIRQIFPPDTDAELANNTRRRIVVIITDGGPHDYRAKGDEPEFEGAADYFEEIKDYYDEELGQDKYPLYVVGVDTFNRYWSNNQVNAGREWNQIASPNPFDPTQLYAFRVLRSDELTSKILDFLCPFLGEVGTSRDCRVVELGSHFIAPYADRVRFSFFKYRDDSEISLYAPNNTTEVQPSNANVLYTEHDERTESYEIISPEPGCWQTTRRGDGRVDVLTDISFKNSLHMVAPSGRHPQLKPLKLAFEARYEDGTPIIQQGRFNIRFESRLFDPVGNPLTSPVIRPDQQKPGTYISTNNLHTPVVGTYTGNVTGFVDIPPDYDCFRPQNPSDRTLRLFDIPFSFEVSAPNIQIMHPKSAHLQYMPLDKIVIDAINQEGHRIQPPQTPTWNTQVELVAPSGKTVPVPPLKWTRGSYEVPGPLVLDETGTYTVKLLSHLPDGTLFHEAQASFNTTQHVLLLDPYPIFPVHTPILTTTVQLQDDKGQPVDTQGFPLRLETALLAPDETLIETVPLQLITDTVPGRYAAATSWVLDTAEPHSIKVTGYLQHQGSGPGGPEEVAFITTFPLSGSNELPRFEVTKPKEKVPIEENMYALHGGWSEWFRPTPMGIEVRLYQGESLVDADNVFEGNLDGLFTATVEDMNGNVLFKDIPLAKLPEGQIGILASELTELNEVGDYQVRVHLDGTLLNGEDYRGVVPDIIIPFRLYETPLYLTVRVVVRIFLILLFIAAVILVGWFIWGFLPPHPLGTLTIKTTSIGLSSEIIQELGINRSRLRKKKVVIRSKQISSRLKLRKIVIWRASQVNSSRARSARSSILTSNGGKRTREEIIEIRAYSKDKGKGQVASGKLYGSRGNQKIICKQQTDDDKRYEFTYKQQ